MNAKFGVSLSLLNSVNNLPYITNREMLNNTLRALVYELFLETFY